MTHSKEISTELHWKILLTRAFEEVTVKFSVDGRIHGVAHFSIDEEATGVGVCSAPEIAACSSVKYKGTRVEEKLLLNGLSGVPLIDHSIPKTPSR